MQKLFESIGRIGIAKKHSNGECIVVSHVGRHLVGIHLWPVKQAVLVVGQRSIEAVQRDRSRPRRLFRIDLAATDAFRHVSSLYVEDRHLLLTGDSDGRVRAYGIPPPSDNAAGGSSKPLFVFPTPKVRKFVPSWSDPDPSPLDEIEWPEGHAITCLAFLAPKSRVFCAVDGSPYVYVWRLGARKSAVEYAFGRGIVDVVSSSSRSSSRRRSTASSEGSSSSGSSEANTSPDSPPRRQRQTQLVEVRSIAVSSRGIVDRAHLPFGSSSPERRSAAELARKQRLQQGILTVGYGDGTIRQFCLATGEQTLLIARRGAALRHCGIATMAYLPKAKFILFSRLLEVSGPSTTHVQRLLAEQSAARNPPAVDGSPSSDTSSRDSSLTRSPAPPDSSAGGRLLRGCMRIWDNGKGRDAGSIPDFRLHRVHYDEEMDVVFATDDTGLLKVFKILVFERDHKFERKLTELHSMRLGGSGRDGGGGSGQTPRPITEMAYHPNADVLLLAGVASNRGNRRKGTRSGGGGTSGSSGVLPSPRGRVAGSAAGGAGSGSKNGSFLKGGSDASVIWTTSIHVVSGLVGRIHREREKDIPLIHSSVEDELALPQFSHAFAASSPPLAAGHAGRLQQLVDEIRSETVFPGTRVSFPEVKLQKSVMTLLLTQSMSEKSGNGRATLSSSRNSSETGDRPGRASNRSKNHSTSDSSSSSMEQPLPYQAYQKQLQRIVQNLGEKRHSLIDEAKKFKQSLFSHYGKYLTDSDFTRALRTLQKKHIERLFAIQSSALKAIKGEKQSFRTVLREHLKGKEKKRRHAIRHYVRAKRRFIQGARVLDSGAATQIKSMVDHMLLFRNRRDEREREIFQKYRVFRQLSPRVFCGIEEKVSTEENREGASLLDDGTCTIPTGPESLIRPLASGTKGPDTRPSSSTSPPKTPTYGGLRSDSRTRTLSLRPVILKILPAPPIAPALPTTTLSSHPSLVDVFAVHPCRNGLVYVALEWCQENLAQRLQRAVMSPELSHQLLSPDFVVALLRSLLEALAFLHGRGLVHRSLAPDTVYMVNEGRAKLEHLGLMKSLRTPEMLQFGYCFASPEVLAGSVILQASDIWSLGVLAAMLLNWGSSERFFTGKNDVPTLLQHLLRFAVDTTDGDIARFLVDFVGGAKVALKMCPAAELVSPVPRHPVRGLGRRKKKQLNSLLGKMLKWLPEKRISAAEALRSSLFSGA